MPWFYYLFQCTSEDVYFILEEILNKQLYIWWSPLVLKDTLSIVWQLQILFGIAGIYEKKSVWLKPFFILR